MLLCLMYDYCARNVSLGYSCPAHLQQYGLGSVVLLHGKADSIFLYPLLDSDRVKTILMSRAVFYACASNIQAAKLSPVQR